MKYYTRAGTIKQTAWHGDTTIGTQTQTASAFRTLSTACSQINYSRILSRAHALLPKRDVGLRHILHLCKSCKIMPYHLFNSSCLKLWCWPGIKPHIWYFNERDNRSLVNNFEQQKFIQIQDMLIDYYIYQS